MFIINNMGDNYLERLCRKFSQYGVLHRDEPRGYNKDLMKLIRLKFVQKVHKKGRVFYELTEKGLDLLEEHRKMLVCELKKCTQLFPRKHIYKNLLNDPRFIDEKDPIAQKFLFLGDWQFNRPIVKSQLLLAQNRFYQKMA